MENILILIGTVFVGLTLFVGACILIVSGRISRKEEQEAAKKEAEMKERKEVEG